MNNSLLHNKLLPVATNSRKSKSLRVFPKKEKSNKFLFIDDCLDMRMIMATIFSTTKWKIICAENGSMGLKLAKKIHPALILCDINMPEIDGYQVLQAVRADKNMGNIPFIFLSSESKPESRDRAMKLGADYFLRKPVDFGELLELLDILMPDGIAEPLD